MKKQILVKALALTSIVISYSMNASTLILKNDTNQSFTGRGTSINFSLLYNGKKLNIQNDKLCNLKLMPGKSITINSSNLPSTSKNMSLQVKFNKTYETLVLGFDCLNQICLEVNKLVQSNTEDPNIVPNFSIKYGRKQNVKEIDFEYTSIFS